jgi:hypothetical protein
MWETTASATCCAMPCLRLSLPNTTTRHGRNGRAHCTLQAAAVIQRIASGPRAGHKVLIPKVPGGDTTG